MKIDGKKIAEKIKEDLKQIFSQRNFKLAIVQIGDNPASNQFVSRKKKIGQELGVELIVHDLLDSVRTEDVLELIQKLGNDDTVDGIVVQLPLPSHIDTPKIIASIEPTKDVDALSGESIVLSPVVEAVKTILTEIDLSLDDKKIVVIGQGRLVGRPIAIYLAQEGLAVDVTDAEDPNLASVLSGADIVISGIGRPCFIKGGWLKTEAVLIDVGTSEQNGVMVGDFDSSCYEKASFYTPVPGGVGPIVVVKLFENLWKLGR